MIPSSSIRQRLIIWFAAALTIFMIVSGGVWYWRLSHSFLQHTDDELTIVADDYFTHHLESKTGRVDPCDALEHLLSGNHHLLSAAAFENGGNICSFDDTGVLPTTAIKTFHDDYHFISHSAPDNPVRILQAQKGDTTLLFARSIEFHQKALRELVYTLAILSPLAAFLIFALGRLVADRAVEPMSEITDQVRRITAYNLNTRLSLAPPRDELYRLGETFNDMLERLQDAFDRVQRFTADASHELRTPLAILRGETEVALRFSKDPEEFREVLISNLEEIERMTRIIEGLLELTKSANGQITLSPQEIDLGQFIESLITDTTMLAGEEEKVVTSSVPETLPVSLMGDRMRLYQAFLNIVTNAIKYTPGQGTIDIAVLNTASEISIRITDTGMGIPASDIPKVFDRFYRVDAHRSSTIKGTGLGLSIVKWIIDMHHGTIEVESEVDKGTAVTITLPHKQPSTD